MNGGARAALAALLAFAATGCRASLRETHIFQVTRPGATMPNFLKIEVNGYAAMGNARFVAGYYDERAVDLFFNEIRPKAPDAPPIPSLCARPETPGAACTGAETTDDTTHGAYLMIFSTNAAAVSDVIGQFAENQLVADALTTWLHKDEIREQRARTASAAAYVRAQQSTVDLLGATLGKDTTGTKANAERELLRAMQVVARGLGYRGPIDNVQQVVAFLEAKP